MATASKKTPTTVKTATITAKKPVATAESKSTSTKTATAKPAAVKKTTASKPAATKATTTAPKKAAPKKKEVSVSPEHRYHMIATAAYFLAERRGFAGGYQMQDWISAEAQIDSQLKD